MKRITKRQFRILLTVSLGMVMLGVVAQDFEQRWLPKPLYEYQQGNIEQAEDADWTLSDCYFMAVLSVSIIIFIYAIVGLYRFWPVARRLFLLFFILQLLPLPYEEPYIYTTLAGAFYDTSILLFGMVLALIYFSPVAEWFDRKSSDPQMHQTKT